LLDTIEYYANIINKFNNDTTKNLLFISENIE